MNDALVVALVFVILVDIRAWTSVRFLWQLHGEDRASDDRVPKPRLRLTFVKAITATLTTIGTTYLIGITGTRLLAQAELIDVDYQRVAEALSPITLAVFLVILVSPIVSAEYLRFRRRQALALGGQYAREEVPLDQTSGRVRGAPAEGLHEDEVGEDLERSGAR